MIEWMVVACTKGDVRHKSASTSRTIHLKADALTMMHNGPDEMDDTVCKATCRG
jgi:hypothetical protein